jgi:hypothetical protein
MMNFKRFGRKLWAISNFKQDSISYIKHIFGISAYILFHLKKFPQFHRNLRRVNVVQNDKGCATE